MRIPFLRRPAPVDPRTKLCSSCRGQLPWDASYCHHCGAGKRGEDEEARPPTGLARWLPTWGMLLACAVLVGALVGVALWWRARQDQQTSDERLRIQLQGRQEELRSRIEALSSQHSRTVEQAQEWVRAARIQKTARMYERSERAKDEAERLFADADRLAQSLGDLKDELRQVEADLAGLGASP